MADLRKFGMRADAARMAHADHLSGCRPLHPRRAVRTSVPTKFVIRMLVLTFIRPGELRWAQQPELDLEHGAWTVPTERPHPQSDRQRFPTRSGILARVLDGGALSKRTLEEITEDITFPGAL